MLAAIAWRNLWRNPRRTILSLVAISLPLSLVQCMSGMMHGMGDRLVDAVTETQVGHIQIHQEGYRSHRGRWRTVPDAELALETVRGVAGIEAATGRIYGIAHASFVRGTDAEIRAGGGEDLASPVVALIGVDPLAEASVTDMEDRVSEGRWLEGEADVLIGHALAQSKGLQIGDAFLPTAVDSSGAMRGPWAVSDRVPRIVGIMRTGVNEIDRRMVLLPRRYLAALARMEGEVHEIAIRAEEHDDLESLVTDIEGALETARAEAQSVATIPATVALAWEIEGAEGAEGAERAEGEEGAEESDGGSAAISRLRLVGVTIDTDAEPDTPSEDRRLRGRFLSRADEIVLSAEAAAALSVSPGGEVTVLVPVDCGEDVQPADCPPSAERFSVSGVLVDNELLQGPHGLVAASVVTDNILALSPSAASELTGDDADRVGAGVASLRGSASQADEVLAWYDIVPAAKQMMDMMDAMIVILVVIIYMAVFLIIMATILMATLERTHEIGVMAALGMRGRRVVAMVLTESALLSVVGIAIGLALGLSVESYFVAYGMHFGTMEEGMDFSGITIDPVLWPRIVLEDVVSSSITVFVMTTLAGLVPAIRAARLNVIEALREE